MKYLPETETLQLSPAELNSLRARLKVVPNVLSPFSQFELDGKTEDIREFEELPAEKQTAFLQAIRTFSAPECSILWHETVSDQSITRSAATWTSNEPEMWTFISWNSNGIWLRRLTASGLNLGVSRFLGVYPGLETGGFCLNLSNDAALTTLVALDYCLQAQLLAMLQHANPAGSFTPGELQARFEEAPLEDFRWPLLFLEKLIPVDLSPLAKQERLLNSLGELTKVGLLTCVEDEDSQPMNNLYMFSEAGEALRQGFLHETSKVGLRVSALSESGEVAHEIFLFLRDPFSLWMFDLTGREAAISDLSEAEWQPLIQKILDGKHEERIN
jgi:hypothetical protein